MKNKIALALVATLTLAVVGGTLWPQPRQHRGPNALRMKAGKEVDMSGTFDWFGKKSHPSYRGITDAQFKSRMPL